MRCFLKSLAKTLPHAPIILGRRFKSPVPSMGTISLLQREKGDHEVVDEVFSEKLSKELCLSPHAFLKESLAKNFAECAHNVG